MEGFIRIPIIDVLANYESSEVNRSKEIRKKSP